jgi:hypothetical protein
MNSSSLWRFLFINHAAGPVSSAMGAQVSYRNGCGTPCADGMGPAPIEEIILVPGKSFLNASVIEFLMHVSIIRMLCVLPSL